MSDTTTPSSPVVDPSRRDDLEKAASPDTKPEEVVMTWQLKALLAGRTPLPSSRPKRKSDEIERSESSEYPDSSTLEEDAQSAKCVNGSRSEDGKENIKVKHVAKKPRPSNAKTARKQWSDDDIHRLIIMRRKQVSWERILKQFPARTLVSVRQIFWKYDPKM
ncbi:hypothetical protein ACHAPV_008223 [Trichoderma viride]